MFNIICGLWFMKLLVFNKIMQKVSKAELILRILSGAILIYKTVYFILENVQGNVSIPIEISNISYFLLPIIILFRVRKLYSVGAFFGIMAGLGFFLFYIVAGFTVEEFFTTQELLIMCFCHGYLLITGLYLFQNYKFENTEKPRIWITIFAMLCWSLVFYNIEMRGITFIHYIIKPEFLLVFDNMSLNILLMALYYSVLVTAFAFVVKAFFAINHRQKKHFNPPHYDYIESEPKKYIKNP